jgi:hypothetical protein
MPQARVRPDAPPGKKRPNGGRRAGSGRWGSAWLQCTVCQNPERGRIDYLCATTESQRAVARQFGLVQETLRRHFNFHVTDRYKAMARASHNPSFDKLLKDATEANSESVDTLNLIIRGHTQRWGCCLDAGDDEGMKMHARVITEALTVRSRITLEIASPSTITVNNYMLRDAAELANTLRNIPGAAEQVEAYYRMQGRLIEAEARIEAID